MSELNQGSWQPDPFGRHAQRYFDGTNWTPNVIDKSGRQTTDPPLSWVPSAAAPTQGGPEPLSMVMAVTGALLLVLSLFVLNWFEFSASEKADINSTSNTTVQVQLGLSKSDVLDGLKFTELKTLSDHVDGNTLSGPTDQYLSVGYLVAVVAAVFGVLVLFTSGLQRPIAIVAVLFAGWHGHTVYEFMDANTNAEFGAWLGSVGLVFVAVALLLPRRQSAVAVA